MGAAKHPPNNRLRWQRLERGWNRDELVEQIRRSATAAGEPAPGLNAEVVRRWESGLRRPEPRYRKYLVQVFGLPASQLGLLTDAELALRPDDQVHEQSGRRTTSEVVPGNNGFGEMTLSQHDDGIGRQDFLRLLVGVSIAPLVSVGVGVPPDATSLTRGPVGRLDPLAVDAYYAITRSHRSLYWTMPPHSLLPAVAAQTSLGVEMIRSSDGPTESTVTRLASAVAESALLTARVAFFDVGEIDVAHRAFDVAHQAVAVAEDHALAAAVCAHRAFIPGFAGVERPARELLDAARAHARYQPGPLLRAWLHCVDAEISARLGQPDAAAARVQTAEDAMDSGGTDPDWLDFFDGPRLAGFTGNALLLAGRHKAAEVRLRQALDGLANDATKQRAVVLLDLATAQASMDPAQALDTAGDACAILQHDYYATALGRIPAVRMALAATPYASSLDEQVYALGSPRLFYQGG